jgi:predicted lipid-binding transport protein (Tim44 family)
MSGTIDLSTIIFLVIAVLIFLRLRSVLGKRTGNEKPPYDPYSAQQAGGAARDKVVQLPGTEQQGGSRESASEDQLQELVRDYAPKGSPLAEKLAAIMRADRGFDLRQFIEGANTAYEMVVTAFAAGNTATLKELLSSDVYKSFASAIEERESAGETVDFKFVGIDKTEIADANLVNGEAQITVKFVSEFITVTHDKEGRIIEGDPKEIQDVTDHWTFSRQINASDPNWVLIATETES